MEKTDALAYVYHDAGQIAEEYDHPCVTIEHELLAAIGLIKAWSTKRLPRYLQLEATQNEIAETYALLNSHAMFSVGMTESFITESFEDGEFPDDGSEKTGDTAIDLVGMAEKNGGVATLPMMIEAMLRHPTALVHKCVLREPPKTNNVKSFEDWFS